MSEERESFNQEIDSYVSKIKKIQRKNEGSFVLRSMRFSAGIFRRIILLFNVSEHIRNMKAKRDIEEYNEEGVVSEENEENKNIVYDEVDKMIDDIKNSKPVTKVIVPIDKAKIKQDIVDVIMFMDSYLEKLSSEAKAEFMKSDFYEKYKSIMKRYFKNDGKL